MQQRGFVHALVRFGLIGAFLLASRSPLLAQDDVAQPVDNAGWDAGPLPAEFGEASLAPAGDDPNLAAMDEVLSNDPSAVVEAALAGHDVASVASELIPFDVALLGADSTQATGPVVDEHGAWSVPLASDHLLFLPAVATDGTAATGEVLNLAEAGSGGQPAASQSIMGDFNGDGSDDLAIGVPYEDIVFGGNQANAGAVHVLYGGVGGIAAANNQFWALGVEALDLLGHALAAGDFNGDGLDDLAIGVPSEDFGAVVDAGAVYVLYGTGAGLAVANLQFWTQDTPTVHDTAENADSFGRALVAGDFNCDGLDDLAVGVPYEDQGAIVSSGLVHTFYGSAAGLSAVGNKPWGQNIPGVLDVAEANDNYGWTLAAGDFNANGCDDLAVGVPNEDVIVGAANVVNAGGVSVLYGLAAGLSTAGNQFFTENSPGILGVVEPNDNYGWALAAGDFNASGQDDLAIGIPLEDFVNPINAGAVNVIYGPLGVVDQVWTQDSFGIQDVAETGDYFGWALGAASFDGDAITDLAVGVPYEDVLGFFGNINNAGAVNVIYGAATGLDDPNNQFWTQNSLGVLDAAEANDTFGLSLATGDFDASGSYDLVAGVPYEDLAALNQGAANVIYGALGASLQQFWSQDSALVLDLGEANDLFAYVNQ